MHVSLGGRRFSPIIADYIGDEVTTIPCVAEAVAMMLACRYFSGLDIAETVAVSPSGRLGHATPTECVGVQACSPRQSRMLMQGGP